MSNDTYEMYGKLSAQLGKLVIDGKRHLPTVNATLHSLVFDTYRWPRAKNWEAIHALAQSNQGMAAVVATLDLSLPGKRIQQIIAAFPDCFLDVEVRDIIPLSCIRALAIEAARKFGEHDEDPETAADFPESYNVHFDNGIPAMRFVTSENSDLVGHYPMLPEGIDPMAKQGTVVMFDGIEHVVFENNQNTGVYQMTLVLREHVDPTC